jgi:hypothetical protein
VLGPKRQPHGDRAAGHHPTRARGLKELTLNSSILVAAPRWRRCVAVSSSLGAGTSAGLQLSGARPPAPAPSAFWLFAH